MKKTHKGYEGALKIDLTKKILLNVDHLAKGQYEIIIIQNGKPVKQLHFTKK
ncbi:hypothetical protein GCM10023207_23110 [Marivirga lumbricoides]|uniref:hypothetical protein n=1 Tax=Marivirga lumbricoides TaxID=1046115 RepID=UPI00166A8729